LWSPRSYTHTLCITTSWALAARYLPASSYYACFRIASTSSKWTTATYRRSCRWWGWCGEKSSILLPHLPYNFEKLKTGPSLDFYVFSLFIRVMNCDRFWGSMVCNTPLNIKNGYNQYLLWWWKPENEMSRSCSIIHGRDEKCMRNFCSCRWEDIRMGLREIG